MTLRIEDLRSDGPYFDGAIAVYGEAFAEPPYSDPDRGEEIRARLLDTHAQRPGFQAFVALLGDSVVGMTYGYHGSPGQWWHDTVAKRLQRDVASKWLGDSYELVEIAVSPAHQGKGIGSALIERLLRDRDEATCVLSTRTDSEAHRLYRRHGFEVIVEMAFVSRGALFFVMGKRLP
ncbi:MAG TPA: GNAT family N-acetyltransferase [Tepidiformaceae bacterium]|nr:GNAT family N-acetyltransferase [Tepidiformaceae bacterium]